MNRMLKLAAVAAAAAGGLGSVGCAGTERPSLQDRYAGYVDPCWPQRYSFLARNAVVTPYAEHATNGAIVDQTLFNYHFEPGTDKLTVGGLDKLDYLARRRPAPDPKVFLATSRDMAYDPAAPEKLVAARQELDAARAQAVHRYLAASTAPRPLSFEVQVLDTPDLTMNAQGPATAVRGYPNQFLSGLGGGAGALAGAGGGQVTSNVAPGGRPSSNQ
jgi:outer membrane protein OmpA-like peptidoglycan-associated protein